MSRLSPASQTLLLFLAFLLAGAAALAASAVLMGRLIVDAGDGDATIAAVVTAGALVGTLASYVVHEVTALAPGVVRAVTQQRS